MFKFSDRIAVACAALLFVSAPSAWAVDNYSGVGRAATPAEIKAWDIDVRPDFKGLPHGSGSVDRGQTVWEEKCAVCHGTFAESNQVFTPLVGGTTKDDIKTGHVANLQRRDYPQRTTFMKVATVSTLYDYIRRAMPWNAPKSLSDDDVYAVLAYLLNLAEIVPDDFVLSDKTMPDVQKLMPNRNGMTQDHAMWPGQGLGNPKAHPDTKNTPCMKNCKKTAEVASFLPDYAEASHGNLASQNRPVGPVRGKKTGADEQVTLTAGAAATKLADASGCFGCHAVNSKLVGPAYADVAAKYRGKDKAQEVLARVRNGSEGVWGSAAMPPMADVVKDEDLKSLVDWILAGAPAK